MSSRSEPPCSAVIPRLPPDTPDDLEARGHQLVLDSHEWSVRVLMTVTLFSLRGELGETSGLAIETQGCRDLLKAAFANFSAWRTMEDAIHERG